MWGLGLRHLIVEYVNYNQDTPVANTGICIALESMITESKHSEQIGEIKRLLFSEALSKHQNGNRTKTNEFSKIVKPIFFSFSKKNTSCAKHLNAPLCIVVFQSKYYRTISKHSIFKRLMNVFMMVKNYFINVQGN